MIIDTIHTAFWLMLPAYFANSSAVIFGGGTPIDFGRNMPDGRRILGDGKTFKGLIGATCLGTAVGLVQSIGGTSFSSILATLPIISIQFSAYVFPQMSIVAAFVLAAGTLFGDMAASFLKRRINIERGAQFPVIDQLDFVAGAWLFAYVFAHDWFIANFSLAVMAAVIIITPLLHIATNILAYKLGLKDVPW